MTLHEGRKMMREGETGKKEGERGCHVWREWRENNSPANRPKRGSCGTQDLLFCTMSFWCTEALSVLFLGFAWSHLVRFLCYFPLPGTRKAIPLVSAHTEHTTQRKGANAPTALADQLTSMRRQWQPAALMAALVVLGCLQCVSGTIGETKCDVQGHRLSSCACRFALGGLLLAVLLLAPLILCGPFASHH